MKLRFALLAYTVVMFSPLYAADIYRWVDESGRTHFSDAVPEKYKKSTTKVDSRQYELTIEQQKEAAARAVQEKARVAATKQRKTDTATAEVPDPAAVQVKPRPVVNESTDCATLQRLYKESQECFSPYRTANGSTKAEAFEKCTPINDPTTQCGPTKY